MLLRFGKWVRIPLCLLIELLEHIEKLLPFHAFLLALHICFVLERVLFGSLLAGLVALDILLPGLEWLVFGLVDGAGRSFGVSAQLRQVEVFEAATYVVLPFESLHAHFRMLFDIVQSFICNLLVLGILVYDCLVIVALGLALEGAPSERVLIFLPCLSQVDHGGTLHQSIHIVLQLVFELRYQVLVLQVPSKGAIESHQFVAGHVLLEFLAIAHTLNEDLSELVIHIFCSRLPGIESLEVQWNLCRLMLITDIEFTELLRQSILVLLQGTGRDRVQLHQGAHAASIKAGLVILVDVLVQEFEV